MTLWSLNVPCVSWALTQILAVAPQRIYVLGTVPCGLTLNQLALILSGSWLGGVRDAIETTDPSPRAIAFICSCLNL